MTKEFTSILTAAALALGLAASPAAFADGAVDAAAKNVKTSELSRADAKQAALRYLNGSAGNKYRVGEIVRSGNHWKVTVLNRAGLPVSQVKVHVETGEVSS
ncbi:MAG TPA: hypothetical protein VIK87_02210 [Sphingomonadales bacterium]